jgi:LTXXQ motif family protein
MRKALLPMIASLALCGAATGALIATNASAAGTPKKPVMVAMVGSPSIGMTTAAAPDMGPPPGALMDAPGDMGGAGPMDGKMRERFRAHMAQMCKDMYAHKVGEMAFLETKLALTPAQAPLFARWKQVNLDIAQHRSGECDTRLSKAGERKAGDRPSMVDRMAREEEMLKTRLANLEVERPALAALYNVLTPDQRAELGHAGMGGQPMMRNMMMGMMARRRGMGPMGGPGMGPMGHGPADAPPPPPPQ